MVAAPGCNGRRKGKAGTTGGGIRGLEGVRHNRLKSWKGWVVGPSGQTESPNRSANSPLEIVINVMVND